MKNELMKILYQIVAIQSKQKEQKKKTTIESESDSEWNVIGHGQQQKKKGASF